jgi:hypothetical protein
MSSDSSRSANVTERPVVKPCWKSGIVPSDWMKDEISKNMNFSAILDKDGVVEMGRKSTGLQGLLNFGKGIIVACFHAKGTFYEIKIF